MLLPVVKSFSMLTSRAASHASFTNHYDVQKWVHSHCVPAISADGTTQIIHSNENKSHLRCTSVAVLIGDCFNPSGSSYRYIAVHEPDIKPDNWHLHQLTERAEIYKEEQKHSSVLKATTAATIWFQSADSDPPLFLFHETEQRRRQHAVGNTGWCVRAFRNFLSVPPTNSVRLQRRCTRGSCAAHRPETVITAAALKSVTVHPKLFGAIIHIVLLYPIIMI